MIGTERKKAHKFQEGLAHYLQHRLTPLIIGDYAEAYERVLVIEQTFQRLALYRQGQKKKRSSGIGGAGNFRPPVGPLAQKKQRPTFRPPQQQQL